MNRIRWRHALLAISLVCAAATAMPAAQARTRVARKSAAFWPTVRNALPADVRSVIGVSGAKLRALPAFADLWTMVRGRPEVSAILDAARADCGGDPVEAVDNVVIATDANDEAAIFVSMKGWGEAKLTACLTKIVDRTQGKKLTAKRTGNIVEYTLDGEKLHVAWPAREVFMITTRPEDLEHTRRMIGGQGAFAGSTEWNDALGLVRLDALGWVVLRDLDIVSGRKATATAITLDHVGSNDVAIDTRLRMASAADAQAVENELLQGWQQLQSQMPPQMAGVIKAVKIGSTDRDVNVSATVAIDQLLQLLGPIF